jgi:hypothetical protein
MHPPCILCSTPCITCSSLLSGSSKKGKSSKNEISAAYLLLSFSGSFVNVLTLIYNCECKNKYIMNTICRYKLYYIRNVGAEARALGRRRASHRPSSAPIAYTSRPSMGSFAASSSLSVARVVIGCLSAAFSPMSSSSVSSVGAGERAMS